MLSNQNGRSMIEMLGVLAIVGILSVGGLDMISKARKSNKIANLLGGISNLASTLVQQRKYAAEVKSDYNGDYALFLKRSGKIPQSFTASDDSSGKYFSRLTIEMDADNVVVVSLYDLDKEACVKVLTNNWGTRSTTRFVGVMSGTADFGCVSSASCTSSTTSAFPESSDYPMPIVKATSACASASNTVNLGYKL